MNASDPTTARPLPLLLVTVPVAPPRNARYPGSSGSTHGETKEIRPAANAKGIAAMIELGSTASKLSPL